MSRDELSLLLYLESCAVDHGGKVEARRMNEDEFAIADGWKTAGFILFGRMKAAEILKERKKHIARQATNWVVLSEAAWAAAHAERRARCVRTMEVRKHQFNGLKALK